MSAQLHVVGPRNKNRSVPVRRPNDDLRSREYLTVAEVERLMKAARTAATVTGTLPRSWLPSDMGCGLQRELCRRFIVMASGA